MGNTPTGIAGAISSFSRNLKLQIKVGKRAVYEVMLPENLDSQRGTSMYIMNLIGDYIASLRLISDGVIVIHWANGTDISSYMALHFRENRVTDREFVGSIQNKRQGLMDIQAEDDILSGSYRIVNDALAGSKVSKAVHRDVADRNVLDIRVPPVVPPVSADVARSHPLRPLRHPLRPDRQRSRSPSRIVPSGSVETYNQKWHRLNNHITGIKSETKERTTRIRTSNAIRRALCESSLQMSSEERAGANMPRIHPSEDCVLSDETYSPDVIQDHENPEYVEDSDKFPTRAFLAEMPPEDQYTYIEREYPCTNRYAKESCKSPPCNWVNNSRCEFSPNLPQQ
jgi:hypothetical protein